MYHTCSLLIPNYLWITFLQQLEAQAKIDLKKKDIEKLQEKERALMATFTLSLGENNKFADYLTKVFKKRVKRTKKKTTEGEGENRERKGREKIN